MADALGIETSAPAGNTAQTALSARDLLTALFYHRKAATIAFAVPVLLGLAGALLSTTNYTADAKFVVLLGPEYVYTPQAGAAGSGIAFDRNQIIESELDILQSEELSEATVDRIGINRLYPHISTDRPDATRLAAAQFAKDLTVTSATDSNVVDVSFKNHDRELSAETVNELLSLYVVRRGEVFNSLSNQTAAERSNYAARLADAESQLAAFSASHGITDLDQQITLLATQRSTLDTLQQSDAAQIAQTRAQIDTLQRQLAGLPSEVPQYEEATRSDRSEAALADLARLQTQQRALAARYQPDFPAVVELNREVAAETALTGANVELAPQLARMGRNTLYDDLNERLSDARSDLKGLEASAQALTQQAADLQQKSAQLTSYGAEYRNLKRERDVLDATYSTFVQNSEVSSLNAALARARASDVRILQSATPPAKGSSPRIPLLLGGIVVGFLASIGTVALLSLTRQVMIGTYDTEMNLGLPVLLAVAERRAS